MTATPFYLAKHQEVAAKRDSSLSWAAWRKRMLDLIFIILVLFFFALSFWYVVFCERV